MRTVKQAADALGISPQRVRFLIDAKRIKAVKVGQGWAVKSIKILPAKNPVGWPKGRKRK